MFTSCITQKQFYKFFKLLSSSEDGENPFNICPLIYIKYIYIWIQISPNTYQRVILGSEDIKLNKIYKVLDFTVLTF